MQGERDPASGYTAPLTYKADWRGCVHLEEPGMQKQAASFSDPDRQALDSTETSQHKHQISF